MASPRCREQCWRSVPVPCCPCSRAYTAWERAWGRRLAKRFGVDAKYDANTFIAATGSADGYLDHESSKPDKLDADVVEMFKAVPVSKGGAMIVYGWTMAEDLVKLGARS